MSSNEATTSPSGAVEAGGLSDQGKRSSTLNLHAVLDSGDERLKTFTSAEDQAIASIVEDRLSNMDCDGDGRIDSNEMHNTMFDVAKEALRQDKKIRTNKKVIFSLAGFSVLLVGCVFGTSIAAAYLAKDTQVNDSRALMTNTGEPAWA